MTVKKNIVMPLILFTLSSLSALELPYLFSDNMVLQRNEDISVWGWAKPGKKVVVTLKNQKQTTKAAQDSTWKIVLSPEDADSNLTLTIKSGKEKKIVENVSIGEVWLCSGQSNMRWILRNTENWEEECESANYSQLRMITIVEKALPEPGREEPASWLTANPENVCGFSAVGYYFAKNLHKKLSVPVGIIASSWGGTPAEAWIKRESLETHEYFNTFLKRYDSYVKENQKEFDDFKKITETYYEKIEKQYRRKKDPNHVAKYHHDDTGNDGVKKGWSEASFDDSNWETIELPGFWENSKNLQIDGAVWFRKKIKIPEILKNKEIVLQLGAIDDFDMTYVNGELVGNTGKGIKNYWEKNRQYILSTDLMDADTVFLAVRVFDHAGNGGFNPEFGEMKLYTKENDAKSTPLSGVWKYKIEKKYNPESLDEWIPKRPPVGKFGPRHPHAPSNLYNGMIAPLVPYNFKGVLWYQGEANSRRAYQYNEVLPLLIKSWREQWKKDFPFGIIQLANYNTPEKYNVKGVNWAELREAQALTAYKDSLNGLIVTIDIGLSDNIHPTNKHDVGKRASLWAFNQVYKIDTAYSGPVFKNKVVTDDSIYCQFTHVYDSLMVLGDTLTGFEIGDKTGNFTQAHAYIFGKEVVLWSDTLSNPVYIRYGWENDPQCNLYNSAGLPAVPFRTDPFKTVTADSVYSF